MESIFMATMTARATVPGPSTVHTSEGDDAWIREYRQDLQARAKQRRAEMRRQAEDEFRRSTENSPRDAATRERLRLNFDNALREIDKLFEDEENQMIEQERALRGWARGVGLGQVAPEVSEAVVKEQEMIWNTLKAESPVERRSNMPSRRPSTSTPITSQPPSRSQHRATAPQLATPERWIPPPPSLVSPLDLSARGRQRSVGGSIHSPSPDEPYSRRRGTSAYSHGSVQISPSTSYLPDPRPMSDEPEAMSDVDEDSEEDADDDQGDDNDELNELPFGRYARAAPISIPSSHRLWRPSMESLQPPRQGTGTSPAKADHFSSRDRDRERDRDSAGTRGSRSSSFSIPTNTPSERVVFMHAEREAAEVKRAEDAWHGVTSSRKGSQQQHSPSQHDGQPRSSEARDRRGASHAASNSSSNSNFNHSSSAGSTHTSVPDIERLSSSPPIPTPPPAHKIWQPHPINTSVERQRTTESLLSRSLASAGLGGPGAAAVHAKAADTSARERITTLDKLGSTDFSSPWGPFTSRANSSHNAQPPRQPFLDYSPPAPPPNSAATSTATSTASSNYGSRAGTPKHTLPIPLPPPEGFVSGITQEFRAGGAGYSSPLGRRPTPESMPSRPSAPVQERYDFTELPFEISLALERERAPYPAAASLRAKKAESSSGRPAVGKGVPFERATPDPRDQVRLRKEEAQRKVEELKAREEAVKRREAERLRREAEEERRRREAEEKRLADEAALLAELEELKRMEDELREREEAVARKEAEEKRLQEERQREEEARVELERIELLRMEEEEEERRVAQLRLVEEERVEKQRREEEERRIEAQRQEQERVERLRREEEKRKADERQRAEAKRKEQEKQRAEAKRKQQERQQAEAQRKELEKLEKQRLDAKRREEKQREEEVRMENMRREQARRQREEEEREEQRLEGQRREEQRREGQRREEQRREDQRREEERLSLQFLEEEKKQEDEKRQEAQRKQEELLKKREEWEVQQQELLWKQHEKRKQAEEARRQEEEFRKREEEIRRKKLQESTTSSASSYANGTRPTSNASSFSSASSSISGRSGSTSSGSSSWTQSSRTSVSSAGSESSRPLNPQTSSWSEAAPRAANAPSAPWAAPPRPPSNASSSSRTPTSEARPPTGGWRSPSASGHPPPSSSFSSTPPSESEWRRRQEEQARRQQEQFQRDQQRAEQEKMFKASGSSSKEQIVRAWRTYEDGWAAIKEHDVLWFRTLPWPLLNQPNNTDELTANAIGALVLSPHHSQDKSRRDRIKEQLLRWHPDRFDARWLPKVTAEDKEAVKRGAGQVVRGLNELMARENSPFA